MKIKAVDNFFDVLIPSPIWDIYTREFRITGEKEIQVTQLIDSPLRRKLFMKYWENIERKVISLHNQILGIMVHLLFELKEFEDLKNEMQIALFENDKDKVFEIAKKFYEVRDKFLKMEMKDWKITGIYDLFEDGILYDFKITSEYTLSNEKRLRKFEEQLQVYKYMIEETKKAEVKAIKNILLLKNFSVFRSKVSSPLIVVEYEPWDREKVKDFILERLEIHELQDWCDEEDMWMVYQYKIGNKIFTNKEKAENYAKEKRIRKIEVQAKPIRCLYYCEVAEYCEQFKNILELDSKIKEEYLLKKESEAK